MEQVELKEFVERLRSSCSLSSLIGERVALERRSGLLMGCCPFHEERTPSFCVYRDHYHCYGCGAHGDVISFVRGQRGLGFMEALEYLGHKVGLALPEIKGQRGERERIQSFRRQQKLLEESQSFFSRSLRGEAGARARSYLEARGFPSQSWESLGLGYAPKGSTLEKELGAKGYSLKELEEASLLNRYARGSVAFFQDRITVPIRDAQGHLKAFGARALEEGAQKYKNSRYDKKSILFGLYQARPFLAQKGRALVVEGYLDALQRRQAGFGESVACQGTALTGEHLQSLGRLCKLCRRSAKG